jgi:3-oxoacyl-[acyl-carrier protein] reductase
MTAALPLNEKIALVTGASRGIGQAIAKTLAEAGATVIGTATTQEGAEKISEYLKKDGLKGLGVVMNIADPKSSDEALSQIVDKWGAPNILVNNAGVTADNLFLRMKNEEWSKVLETNMTGVFRIMQACIRPMIKARFGRIVNISSVVASTGNAGQTNYAAAKAGLIGLTKSLAREVGSRGITVNVVSPGFIDTDMTRGLAEDQRNRLLEQIPLMRMGDPNDIAEAVLFLVSKGSYITGETLHVNGGMYMC